MVPVVIDANGEQCASARGLLDREAAGEALWVHRQGLEQRAVRGVQIKFKVVPNHESPVCGGKDSAADSCIRPLLAAKYFPRLRFQEKRLE
jgi:hypothetical protein